MENKTLINSEEGRRAGARKVKQMMIPDDVVGEIQQWLPPKSLGRFECVSKNWRSMLLDEIDKRNSKEEKVLLISRSSIQTIDFGKPESDMKTAMLIEFPAKESLYAGCVNGLVLYLDSENRALVLFNPWTRTRQHIKIPHTNPLSPDSYAYGFGYHGIDDKYVIVIIDLENRNGFRWSSKTRNWVTFSNSFKPKSWRPHKLIGLCVNGWIYWERKCNILSFDVKTCKFKRIGKPLGSRRSFVLVVWGDRLAAVGFTIFNTRFPCTCVWELDEQMQWIKIMTLPRFILSPQEIVEYQFFCERRKIKTDADAIFGYIMAPILHLKKGDPILLSYILNIDLNGTKEAGLLLGSGVAEPESMFYLLGRGEDAVRKFYLYNEERNTLTTMKTQDTSGMTYFHTMIPYQNNQFSLQV